MVTTRMERIVDLERGMQEVTEKFARIDSKMEMMMKLVEGKDARFDAIDAYLRELPKFLAESGGKAVNASPSTSSMATKLASNNKTKEKGVIEGETMGCGHAVTERMGMIGTINPIRKMELPVFSSEDPSGWIARVEHYFTINRIDEEERLE